MNILKRIQFLVLLCPIALMGAMKPVDAGVMPALDKTGKQILWNNAPVTLEWHRVTEVKAFFDLYEPLIPTYAQAFADVTRDLLLDETFKHVRKEYVAAVEALPQEVREELDIKIKLATATREERVNHMQQDLVQTIQKERAYLLAHPELNPEAGSAFIVIARSKWNDILGFALFKMLPDDAKIGSIELDELAIAPIAQKRGLARPLAFSVAAIAPEIKRIYLGTKLWNTTAQGVYKALGFKEFHPAKKEDDVIWAVWFEYTVKN